MKNLVEITNKSISKKNSKNDVISVMNGLLAFQLDEKYDKIDFYLTCINIPIVSKDVLLTVLKYTFSFRANLPNWFIYLRDVDAEMRKRGYKEDITFTSLFSEENDYKVDINN